MTWVLKRSEVWVDNRLRRLSRAILPKRGQGIDMIEAAKSHLGKVTPEQPVRARSATAGQEKTLTLYQVRVRRERLKTQRRDLAEKLRGIDQTAQPRSLVLA